MLTKSHFNRGIIGCFRSHIFSCLLIITVFLSPPQLSPSETSRDKIMFPDYLGHIQLKKLGKINY